MNCIAKRYARLAAMVERQREREAEKRAKEAARQDKPRRKMADTMVDSVGDIILREWDSTIESLFHGGNGYHTGTVSRLLKAITALDLVEEADRRLDSRLPLPRHKSLVSVVNK